MEEPNVSKSKRFCFTQEADELLATIVVQLGAHNPDHGTTEKKFEDDLKAFCDSSLFQSMQNKFGTPAPKATSLRNRFNALVDKRKKANKVDVGTSGQERENTEHELVLDGAIEDIENKKQIEQIQLWHILMHICP